MSFYSDLPSGIVDSHILDYAREVKYRKKYANKYESVIPNSVFGGYTLVDDDEFLNVVGQGFQYGDAIWSGDYDVSHDGEGAMRSGAIGNDGESWIETVVTNSTRLSFWWKASSEDYDGEVFDYAYLSVDGLPQGALADYQLQGVAIGGKTGWTNVVFDIMGEGEHTVRWTYVKDEIDESDVGEDCIWLDEVSFDPLATLTFSINGGEGSTPCAISAFTRTSVALPTANGFRKAKHTFVGWNDGTDTYATGTRYMVADTNVAFVAVWRANTLAAPIISSEDVADGGVLEGASATISITAEAGTTIHYTLDGTVPTAASASYDGSFAFDGLSANIKAVAVKDDYYDSPVASFAFTRTPSGLADSLNVPGLSVVTNATASWTKVTGMAAHDGVAALRSGVIGDGESSAVEMMVIGAGQIGFWWKTSSEISRNRKYDYVAFLVDGVEQSWLGGEKDWTNEVFSVSGDGMHTLSWIYQKNDNGKTQGDDCAWLDEVTWTPDDPLPEITGDGEIRAILAGAGDEVRLRAGIASKAEYDAFRTWADENGMDHQTVKDSVHAWTSFWLEANRLFMDTPKARIETMALTTANSLPAEIHMMSVKVTVRDGDEVVNVDAEKVATMFEATRDLNDWTGEAKLVPNVRSVTKGDNGMMTFDVILGDGTATSAFLRIRK